MEFKGISRVRIAHVCPSGYLKGAFSTLQPVGAVCSRNMQSVQAIILPKVKFRSKVLQSVSVNRVKNEVGADRPVPANAEYIDFSRRGSKLSAIERVAARLSEYRVFKDQRRRITKSPPHLGSIVRIIIDFIVKIGPLKCGDALSHKIVCESATGRRRQEADQFQCGGGESSSRNYVAGKGCPQRRICIRSRIVDGRTCRAKVNSVGT